jgi:hypothetical protein
MFFFNDTFIKCGKILFLLNKIDRNRVIARRGKKIVNNSDSVELFLHTALSTERRPVAGQSAQRPGTG